MSMDFFLGPNQARLELIQRSGETDRPNFDTVPVYHSFLMNSQLTIPAQRWQDKKIYPTIQARFQFSTKKDIKVPADHHMRV